MTATVEHPPTRTAKDYEAFPVNLRVKMSALWATMLFVFAYVDIFGFFTPHVRESIESGTISAFTIGEAFLLGTTVYVAIPTLMVFASLVMRPGISRVVNIAVAVVYALTIVAGAIGEWAYYVFGSAIEVGLLAGIVYYAWTWPKTTTDTTLL